MTRLPLIILVNAVTHGMTQTPAHLLIQHDLSHVFCVCVQCVLTELRMRHADPSTCMQVQSQSTGLQFQAAFLRQGFEIFMAVLHW
jgi:hypothetical protein